MNEIESSIDQIKTSSTMVESIETTKIRNIDIIRKYINSQPNEISKLKDCYSQFMAVLNEFVLITQTYSKKLGDIANKIKIQKNDEETFEGKLILILKNQFMKSSDGLKKVTEEIKNETNKIYKGKMNIINNLNNAKSDYFISINNIKYQKNCYEHYMSKYEDFLINEELKKTKNKKINFGNATGRQTTFNDSNKIDSILENVKISIDVDDKEIIKKAIQSQERYLNSITESNNILKKIIDTSSNEKISIRGNIIAEFCSSVDKIICFLIGQKENFLNEKQKIIPSDITNYLKSSKEEQELYNHFLKPVPYSLRCLENYSKTKAPAQYKVRKLSYDFEEDSLPNLVIGNAIHENKPQKNYKLTSKNIINIFNEMKNNNLLLSRRDEKIENEEKEKIFIKKIVKQILKNDNFENLKKEFRKNLLQKMELRKNQEFFLKIFNDYRTKGKFNFDKNAFEFFGEIFQYINNISLNNDDIDIYKLVYIISSTFFYDDGKKKHFLIDYIKNHAKYKNFSFWINYLENQIKCELSNYKNNKSEKEIQINEQKFLKTISFSTLLSVIKNMSDLQIDNKFINEFVNKVNEKYSMNEIQLQTINILLDDETNNKEEDKKGKENLNKIEDKKDKVNKGEDNKEVKENQNKEEDKKDEINKEEDNKKDKENKNKDKKEDKENINNLEGNNIINNDIKEEGNNNFKK